MCTTAETILYMDACIPRVHDYTASLHVVARLRLLAHESLNNNVLLGRNTRSLTLPDFQLYGANLYCSGCSVMHASQT